MTDLTEDEIAALVALEKLASPGPWTVRVNPSRGDDFFVQAPRLRPEDPYDIEVLGQDRTLYDTARADADFTAAARNILPRLLASYTELGKEIERLREALGNLIAMYDGNYRDPALFDQARAALAHKSTEGRG